MFIEIPIFSDGARIYADPLWAKDLLLHFPYIPNLYLCSPVEPLSMAPEGVIEVEGLTPDRVIPLQRVYGKLSILKTFFPNLRVVLHALRQTEIAHSGGAGWPFPLTFYLLVLSLFIKRTWVVIIESSFWMKPDKGRVTPGQWLRHHTYRIFLGNSLRRASARVFTTDSYRQFFWYTEGQDTYCPGGLGGC